jgi:hypothetical protein
MSKAQMIWRHGVTATITDLNGSSYQTRILYDLKTRTSQFSERLTYSINYLRDGVFDPADPIGNGYIVDVPDAGEQSFIVAYSPQFGSGRHLSNLAELLIINYTNIEVRRKQQSYDQWGRPVGSPTWELIGTYPASVDFRDGTLQFNSNLYEQTLDLLILMQSTVPLQIKPEPDRIVVDGVNYQVESLDYQTAKGMVFVSLCLDKRS